MWTSISHGNEAMVFKPKFDQSFGWSAAIPRLETSNDLFVPPRSFDGTFRKIMRLSGVNEVWYNELLEEVVVMREDSSFTWEELQPKVIGVLIEVYGTQPNVHLDHVSLKWDKQDALIDNIIEMGLKPLMQTTNSGKLFSFKS